MTTQCIVDVLQSLSMIIIGLAVILHVAGHIKRGN
jgi:hypothetical protein